MESEITVSKALIEILQRIGVQACFGVPGGQTRGLYGAARTAGFNHVLMRDERNCASAADAYARITSRVGVCDATVGPGVTNLISGLAEAYASSIPVLALVADIDSSLEHLRQHAIVAQAAEQRPMLEPVTKWVARLHRAEMLPDIFEQALRVATSDRPGPVAIEIPQELWEAPISSIGIECFSLEDSRWPRFRPALAEDALTEIVKVLKTAKRPILLTGGGAISSGAFGEASVFADKLGIPVVTSLNAKGIIDERNPLALGVVGSFGNVEASAALLSADTVLAVGTKFTQFNSFRWQLPRSEQTLIHIDLYGQEIGRAINSDLCYQADGKAALRQISQRLIEEHCSFNWEVTEGLPAQPGTPEDDVMVAPELAVSALSDAAPKDSIFVSDASLPSGWSASRYCVKQAARGFIAPRGLAGIGWAGGAAVGAAVAGSSTKRTIVVAGDGGAAFWLGEIETAVRCKLPITFLILNNSSFGWIVQGERAHNFEQESTLGAVDFAAVGRGLGAGGARVETASALSDCLEEAFSCDGPFVVDVLTSDRGNPTVGFQSLCSAGDSESGAYV